MAGRGIIDEVHTDYLLSQGHLAQRGRRSAKPAERYTSILGGHGDLLYEQAGDVKSFIESNKIRPLLSLTEQRFPLFKDVPTAKELGYDIWTPQIRWIFMRAGTDPARVQVLAKALEKMAASDEYKAYLKGSGRRRTASCRRKRRARVHPEDAGQRPQGGHGRQEGAGRTLRRAWRRLVLRGYHRTIPEWHFLYRLVTIMNRTTVLPDPESALLAALGERLRLARRRRRKTAQEVAMQAGITRVTLRRVEAGEPAVTMATYVKVLATLGLAQDLVLVARDDTLGRRLQDEQLQRPLGVKPPAVIRLADYPLLREIAWSTDPQAELSPTEAFAIYERNWRHLDRDAMGAKERKLLARLTATVGNGVLLV
jgi:transcriptional regulator with XRE-family HTH domain